MTPQEAIKLVDDLADYHGDQYAEALRLVLSLLDEAREVVRPFAQAWEDWNPPVAEDFVPGPEVPDDLAFRRAAALLAKLEPKP